LVAALAAIPAQAQQEALLRGLSEASVNISHEMGETDARCGIQEADVRTIVSKALVDKGIKIVDDSPFAELRINFLTLELEGTCISNMRVALRGWATVQLLYDAKKEPRALQVVLREETAMLFSPASQHGGRFGERLRAVADRLGDAVRLDNQ